MSISATEKKGSAAPGGARRKSTNGGSGTKDESRLLKRKEQNCAAQRAFRERKEKHVKDLEDKVADLEAKNERALHENENLKDLLNRLQSENMALKQSPFTFSVPKNAASGAPPAESPRSPQNLFPSASPSLASSSTASAQVSPKMSNPLNWSSLTSFDPAMLNLLDDQPQPTATQGAMQMDFGFGANTGLASNSPYTTIASNPMFHHAAPPHSRSSPASSSSASSPNSMFTSAASRSSPASEMSDKSMHSHDDPGCPKTKQELEQRIASEGASPFAPPPTASNLRKASDMTAKSDKNIEVLSAWRSIRADPKFKDLDINELCAEFTSKARCDGTKVVLEPQGVHSILENLSKKQ
ncbi:hypothetical protein CVT26_010532 [Gymnopilus dilepis]|uniref:BZIP domain-containing protein n=1 Tax=Gymnopilus dilepis TaxID=231916 RepID=A0A409WRN9_9AGAR|nr:hypothetical protein CVT26_010532 [Gymnopilus dilepis]